MSKTNTEKMAPETQTPEMTNGMKLDVRVRPIAPMGNLLAFANVTIGGCFKIKNKSSPSRAAPNKIFLPFIMYKPPFSFCFSTYY